MSALCPCCGGEVSPLDLLNDRPSGRVVYQGADARLSGQEMRLFTALLDAYPRVLTKADLVTAVAQRLKLTFAAVVAAIDAMEAEQRSKRTAAARRPAELRA